MATTWKGNPMRELWYLDFLCFNHMNGIIMAHKFYPNKITNVRLANGSYSTTSVIQFGNELLFVW